MRPDLRTTPQHEFMQKSVNQNRKYESVGVLGAVLTPCNHINGDVLLDGRLVVIVAVFEEPAKFAFVGSSVIVGHIEDVDGAILQVPGILAAVPVQTLVETWVNDLAPCIIINVQLEEEAEGGKDIILHLHILHFTRVFLPVLGLN